jgi:cystathionine beta-lyase/cystathionine gamma-synthase
LAKHPSGIKPESWLVSAGRASEPGAPLNVPLIPASNFIIGSGREYSRDDGTPTWEALEEVVGGLESGKAVAFASGMAAIASVFDQLAAGPLWRCRTIAIRVLQAWQQRALNEDVGRWSAWRWTIRPAGFARAASLT